GVAKGAAADPNISSEELPKIQENKPSRESESDSTESKPETPLPDEGMERIGEEDLPSEEEIIDDPEDLPEPRSRKDAQEEVNDGIAENSEDETANERHKIEKKNYHAMSKEALTAELEKLLKNEKVQAVKEHVEEIRAEFNAKFDEEVEQK